MEKKMVKPLVIGLALVLAAVIAAVAVFGGNVLVNGKLYPKSIEHLDLRGQTVSVKDYEALRKKLPECTLQWDVPLSSGPQAEQTTELTITTLTDEDVMAIGYLRQLQTVHAEGCTDYPQLLALKTEYPHLEVFYTVTIDGTAYFQDAAQIAPAALSEEDIQKLQYLPELQYVLASQCNEEEVEKLQKTYPDLSVITRVHIAGQDYDGKTTALEVSGITQEDAAQLSYLPLLETVHLKAPAMEADALVQLRENLPGVQVTWEVEAWGQTLRSDVTELEFNQTGQDLEQLKQALDYLPDLNKVFMDHCGFDHETMAAWREEKRAQYKVAWTIPCGEMTIRSDDIYFMPRKYELKTGDEAIQDLKYCEDMVCIDIGHSLSVTHCEWAANMPNLKYLILAETSVKDLTPLSGLKNLIFLEIFLSQVNDYTPLLGCTALEDLNLCYTKGDLGVLGEMTWLKRLWIGRAHIDVWNHRDELAEKLPECEINTDVIFSTGQGWRQNKNYFDMRDVLGMFYMK